MFKKFLLGLSLALSVASLAPACEAGLQVPYEREVRETYVGPLTRSLVRPSSPDGGPTLAIAYVQWHLTTKDGRYRVTFATDAVAKKAEKFSGKKVKVVAGLTISGLTVYEIEAAK